MPVKVECESCQAPYTIDERRIPASGLRVRCPKCSKTFVIKRPAEGASAEGGGTPAPSATSVNEGSQAAASPDLPAMKGARARSATIAFAGAPAAYAPPVAPPPAAPVDPFGEIDLPSSPSRDDLPMPGPKAGPKPFAPKRTQVGVGMASAAAAATAAMADDLPVARAEGLDLPSPAGPRVPGPPPRIAPPRKAASMTQPTGGFDLPGGSPFGDEAELPSAMVKGPPPRRPPPTAQEPSTVTAVRDLPAVRRDVQTMQGVPNPDPGAAFGRIDLPAVMPRERDLPAPRGAGNGGFGEIDLPEPTGARGMVDLPSVSAPGAHLPSISGGANLPSVVAAGRNLPSLADAARNLPKSREPADPFGDISNIAPAPNPFASRDDGGLGSAQTAIGPGYAPAGGSFGDVDMPGGPSPNLGGGRGMFDLPPADPFAPSGGGSSSDLGSRGGGRSLAADPFAPRQVSPRAQTDFGSEAHSGNSFGDADPFGASSEHDLIPDPMSFVGASPAGSGFGFGDSSNAGAALEASIPRGESAGGMGFGEVDLGGGSESDEDMEFGAIPQARTSADADIPSGGLDDVPLPARPKGVEETAEDDAPKRPSHVARNAGIAFLILGVLGGTLEFGKHGAFFRNDIADRIHRTRDQQSLRRITEGVRVAIGSESLAKVTDVVNSLDAEERKAPRYGDLVAYVAYANLAMELRFGKDATRETHATQLLSKVEGNGPNKQLAVATRDVVNGSYVSARGVLASLLLADPKNVDAAVTLGELELRDKHPKEAVAAFTKAKAAEDSPRTRAGLMRALAASGDMEGAKVEALAIAQKSKEHASSHLFLAHYAWDHDKNDKEAMTWLTPLDSKPAREAASFSEQIEIATLRGALLLERGRISDARVAFNAAIDGAKGTPAPLAHLGLGEVDMASGQYPLAITEFRIAAEQAPELTLARIGSARALLKQEKPADARAMLLPLKDPKLAGEVGYWLGQAEEKMNPDKPADAMKIYESAIKAQPGEVKPYIALALLQAKIGKPDDADATLKQALESVPPNEKIHIAIGTLRFQQGRYDESLKEFETALTMQPENLDALFGKGRTLLRMDKDSIEKGKAVLEDVSGKDPKYPGLALEQGYYFQTTHQNALALKKYSEALAQAPDDIDVKLQVGRARVEARDPEAEATIRDVLDKCATKSASPDTCTMEGRHYLGRALLNRGAPTEAILPLKQAAEKGDTNAAYHLYYGWALVETDRLVEAGAEIDRALDLDKSIGEAFWLKGEIVAREGLCIDAVALAHKALILSPARHEADALLGMCEARNGQEDQAIADFEKAIKADPNNPKAPFWRFEVTDILAHRGAIHSALADIREAVLAASQMETPPPWLTKAHFYLAEALRGTDDKEAIREYNKYLIPSIGSSDPAVGEATQALKDLGAPFVRGAR